MTLCLVGFAMRKLGGVADGLNSLGIAASIILLLTPCALFEIGFQLSFLASLGIVLFAKRIGHVCDELYKIYRKIHPRCYTEEEKKLLKNGDTLPLTVGERFLRAFVSVLSASFAAQILTAPLQYLAFGYLSGWSFVLNLIFVPLISGVFAFLLLLVVLACLLPLWCGAYLLYVPVMLFNAALLVFEIVDFSTFSLTGMQLSIGSCVCYYGGMIFLTDKWNVSKRQKIVLSAGCFMAFAIILATLNL
jgi:predicted membrane metal-binding protein